MSKPKSILAELKQRGHRMTKVREYVLEILVDKDIPTAAADIIEALKTYGLEVNKTTVYREIDFLLKERIVREVDLLDGKKRYELLAENDHHHHMICTKCSSIQCIDMHHDLDDLERDLKKKFGFKVTSHSLEFFGVCKACA